MAARTGCVRRLVDACYYRRRGSPAARPATAPPAFTARPSSRRETEAASPPSAPRVRRRRRCDRAAAENQHHRRQRGDPAFAKSEGAHAVPRTYPAVVFRDCDIRAASGPCSPRSRTRWAKPGAAWRGIAVVRVAVGRDGRISSPTLCAAALIDGLLATGCEVVDIGMVPTPVLRYFAAALCHPSMPPSW
ncbi:MAG: hypothetical protein IPK48_08435 [Gammaproteobacteria bacterium]|nr:hypothetical protein [Gammaproteobacteria bacterium]